MRTRIKFCGLTQEEDVIHAVQAGADALGFVFFEKSPRAVNVEQARLLMQKVPAFVSIVALVVNADDDLITKLQTLPIDIFQFHGDETAEQCVKLANGKRWIKALQVKNARENSESENNDADFDNIAQSYMQSGASGILLDGYDPSQPHIKGGTGQSFDWQAMSTFIASASFPVVLAGGLTVDNVHEAIYQTKPYAVDVSGGIEEEDAQGNKCKGIKDREKMHMFSKNVLNVI